MQEVKFRCSSLGKIMSNPKKGISPLELSETAKSHIDEIWLKNNYGFKNVVITSEIIKGIVCEKQAIDLLTEFDSEVREKNIIRFEDDFIQGEHDVELSDCIEDIKCSWTIDTFFRIEENFDYKWQGYGYMSLRKKDKFKLRYCGIDTPTQLVTKEINYQLSKIKMEITDGYFDADKISNQIKSNHTFSNLPIEKRIKTFEYNYIHDEIERMHAKIIKAREYYNSLSL